MEYILPSVGGTAGIVINCDTPHLTLLAAKSFVEACPYPLLILDCSRDNSMRALADRAGLLSQRCAVIKWPLAKHGITLDKVIVRLNCQYLYLLDSDAEITNPALPARMLADLQAYPDAYGAGMLHRETSLDATHLYPDGMAIYRERMWIPFVLLKSDVVRSVIRDGISFERQVEYPNYFSNLRLLNSIVGRLQRVGVLSSKIRRRGEKVSEFDTGALVHRELLRKGRSFVESQGVAEGVIHLHGATRRVLPSVARRILTLLGRRLPENSTDVSDIKDYALNRLRNKYGYDDSSVPGE